MVGREELTAKLNNIEPLERRALDSAIIKIEPINVDVGFYLPPPKKIARATPKSGP